MAMGSSTRREFSRNMLQMKFMRRTEGAAQRLKEVEEAAEEKGCQMERWSYPPIPGLPADSSGYRGPQLEPSASRFLDLAPGRLSFGGFNPALEQLTQELAAEKEREFEMTMESTVGDAEMAERLHAIRVRTEEVHSNEMESVLKALRADVEVKEIKTSSRREAKPEKKRKRRDKVLEDGEILEKKKKKKKHPNT